LEHAASAMNKMSLRMPRSRATRVLVVGLTRVSGSQTARSTDSEDLVDTVRGALGSSLSAVPDIARDSRLRCDSLSRFGRLRAHSA
jgi:hypothetical protein